MINNTEIKRGQELLRKLKEAEERGDVENEFPKYAGLKYVHPLFGSYVVRHIFREEYKI